MAEFKTFNLGETLALAEHIKGQRRDAENDRMRNAYMGVQMQNAQQAGQIAADENTRAAADAAAKQQEREARQHYLLADNLERSENPLEFVQQFAPEFIENHEKKYGPGSFLQLTPEQIKKEAAGMKAHFASVAGISLNGTPEQQFAAKQHAEAEAAEFERQKELAELNYGYDLGKIDRQGKYTQERAAAGNERKTFRDIQALRKEFEGQDAVKNYRAVVPIINSARNAPDTGYGDMDLIYAVGKILDPNSVVREGELALTIAASSPLSRLFGAGRFALDVGGRIPPESRKQLIQMLEGRVGALQDQYNQEATRYGGYAQENGWAPQQITGNQPTSPGANDNSGGVPPITATGPNGEKIVLRNGQWVTQ
jgi:hypothetical protein